MAETYSFLISKIRLKLKEMRTSIPPDHNMEEPFLEFDEEFSVTLQKCKVAESIHQILMERQYTSSATFAFAFVNDTALEEFIGLVGTLHDDPPNWSSSAEASSIRHLHHCCLQSVKKAVDAPAVANKTSEYSSGHMGSLLDLAWADLPPVRVKEADFIAMKNFAPNIPQNLFHSPTLHVRD